MISLIVSSIEDTLITKENHYISEEIIEHILDLGKKGVHFAVASARNYDAIYPMFGKVKDDIVYICNDGGCVIYRDEVISKNVIDRLVLSDVTDEFEKDSRYRLMFSREKDAIVTTCDPDFFSYLRDNGVEPEYMKDIDTLRSDITKVTICAKDGLSSSEYERFYTKWSKKANVAVSNPSEAYITAKNITKGTAVFLAQQLFEVSKEDTMVFGGGYSDIDMFSMSYYSYAMQHSDAQVKHEAEHIADNVDTILKDVLLI